MQLYYRTLYSDIILTKDHRFPIQKYQRFKTEIENLGFSLSNF
jgi:hypothetical protein